MKLPCDSLQGEIKAGPPGPRRIKEPFELERRFTPLLGILGGVPFSTTPWPSSLRSPGPCANMEPLLELTPPAHLIGDIPQQAREDA